MNTADIIALIIGGIIAVIAVAYLMINQKKKIVEWLKYAVVEAEKYLGGGTGQLKLRLVYDWFCQQFPVAAACFPFSVFSAWVDVALDAMKRMLSNPQIKEYVGGRADE